MPIYEFKCKKCGNIFEYLCVKTSDKEQVSCPRCGHKKTDIMMSAFSSVNSGNTSEGMSGSSCSPSAGFS